MAVTRSATGVLSHGFLGSAPTFSVAGCAAGDIVLACMACNGATLPATPAGWTLITSRKPSGSPHVALYAATAAGSSATFTYAVGAVQSAGMLVAYRGAAFPTVFSSQQYAGADVAIPAITFSAAGIAVCLTGGGQFTGANAPSGFSTIASGADNSSINLGAFERAYAAGSTGAVTGAGTSSGGPYFGASILVALTQTGQEIGLFFP